MKVLQSALSEMIGLFVDDWLFALALIVWIALFAFGGRRIPQDIAPIVFFTGIAALVLTFIVRKARAK